MHNSVHEAKVTGNFTLQSTPRENAKLKCSEISTRKFPNWDAAKIRCFTV